MAENPARQPWKAFAITPALMAISVTTAIFIFSGKEWWSIGLYQELLFGSFVVTYLTAAFGVPIYIMIRNTKHDRLVSPIAFSLVLPIIIFLAQISSSSFYKEPFLSLLLLSAFSVSGAYTWHQIYTNKWFPSKTPSATTPTQPE